MSSSTTAVRQQRGLTLVESLIAMSIAAITVGLSAPSFKAAQERRHLEGAAATLETAIQLARSDAVLARRTVRIRFESNSQNCYVIYTGPTNACSCAADGQTSCTAGGHALHGTALNGQSVQLQSNVNTMTFDPTQGTVTPTGTIRLTGQNERSVRVVVNLMGRVRNCTPSKDLPGYSSC